MDIYAGQRIWRKCNPYWKQPIEQVPFKKAPITNDLLFRVIPNAKGELEIALKEGMICFCKDVLIADTENSGWINFEIVKTTRNKSALIVRPSYGSFKELKDRALTTELINFMVGEPITDIKVNDNYFFTGQNTMGERMKSIIAVERIFESVDKHPIFYYSILDDAIGSPISKAPRCVRIPGDPDDKYVHGRASYPYTLQKIYPRPSVKKTILTQFILSRE